MLANDDVCPFCGQSSDPGEFVHDLSQMLAEDLEEVAESFVRRQDSDEARWFAQGVGFAVVWLRSRRS
jgi:hypothetical protein